MIIITPKGPVLGVTLADVSNGQPYVAQNSGPTPGQQPVFKVSSTTTLTQANVNQYIVCEGTTDYNVTLANYTILQNGDAVAIKNITATNNVTILCSGTQNMVDKGTPVTSIVLAAGDSKTFVTDGTIWYIY